MKKLHKVALLAAVGLASVSAVKADTYGDLIVGFTTGSGSDVLYDIANGGGNLYNGESWSAATLGISAGSVNSYSWGVIGDALGSDESTSYDSLWTTKAGLAPTTLANKQAWNQPDTGITAVYGNAPGTDPATDPDSWNKETLSGALATDYVNAYLNPNTSGASTINFYQVNDNGTAPTLEGDFSLGSNGTLTFKTVAVPEPATCGMIAGAGLLVFSLRNQLRRKQA